MKVSFLRRGRRMRLGPDIGNVVRLKTESHVGIVDARRWWFGWRVRVLWKGCFITHAYHSGGRATQFRPERSWHPAELLTTAYLPGGQNNA